MAAELLRAVTDGLMSKVERLLAAGVDIEPTRVHGSSPLIVAINKGHFEIAKLLLSAGANVNVENLSGDTPLIIAVMRGNIEIVERLLAAGANVNVGAERGRTPLQMAARYGTPRMIRLLFEHGADPTIEYEGRTVLSLLNRDMELIKLLSVRFTLSQLVSILPTLGLTPDQIKEVLAHHAYIRRRHAVTAWAKTPKLGNNAAGGGRRSRSRRRHQRLNRRKTHRY